MSAANKALIERWFEEVWNQGRAAVIDELLAPGSKVFGVGDVMHGPEGFKPFHTAFRSAFPDLKVTVDHMVAEDDWVAARWSASATHNGDGLGFPGTGRPVAFSGMVFACVENGRLVEGWNSFDQLGMLQQIGVVKLP